MRVKVVIRHIRVLQQKPYITFGGNPLRGIKPEHLLYRKGFTAHKKYTQHVTRTLKNSILTLCGRFSYFYLLTMSINLIGNPCPPFPYSLNVSPVAAFCFTSYYFPLLLFCLGNSTMSQDHRN